MTAHKNAYAALVSVCVCLISLSRADASPNLVHADAAGVTTWRTIGFRPWIPSGFVPNTTSVMMGTPLPSGVKRGPELIMEGSIHSIPVEIHEYRQTHAVGRSDLIVADPRAARLISVWPADHAIVDRSGKIVGFLLQRESVHYDFYLSRGIDPRELRTLLTWVTPQR